MNMIKYIQVRLCCLFILLFPASLKSQVINPVLTTTENFISTKIVKKTGVSDISQLISPSGSEMTHEVTYLDGLGRTLQSIQTMGSPLYKDIVQVKSYDNFGRETFIYQPYAEQVGNGSYKPSALTAQTQYYSVSGWDSNVTKTTAPYNITVFEPSPLNRIKEQGYVGTVWQPAASRTTTAGRTVVIDYLTNDASTAYGTTGYAVRLWSSVPVSGADYKRSLATSGFYTPGQLFLKITKGENWTSADGKAGTTEEYVDKEGRLILKRTFNSSTVILSTYYVYDEMGNLSFVLAPGANPDAGIISQTTLDQFCSQYRYDERGRLIEKRTPSVDGWTYQIYNLLDQLVFSQDTLQRLNQKQDFIKYDGLGRIIMTGLTTNATDTRAFIQNILNDFPAAWEYRNNAGPHGYSNVSAPANTLYMDVETVNYYDDYNITGIPNNQSASFSNKTQGLLTASKVKVLGTSNYLWTINYYDDEGQLVKQYKQHYQSGAINASNYDEVTYTYNFAGELTASSRVHRNASAANTTIANRYEYDHMGRRLRNYQKINTDAEVLLSEYSYNEIGQLRSKALHNGLETVNYTYHDRGWLKSSISGQFSFQLKYQDGTTPLYNGNISGQLWGTGSTLGSNFVYSYDKLGRLTSGIGTGMSETLTYNIMGNIQTLNRNGTTRNYFYNGNRLNNTTGAAGTGTYLYDANGNATYDGRLGQTITYNRLNLPSAIAGLNVTYVYDADGNRLKKISGGVTTDYIDGIQYTAGVVTIIQTEEGIARRNGTSYSYEYDLTDHLGNVRYTFYKNPVTGLAVRLQSDDYFPFGRRMSGSPVSLNNKYLYVGKEIQDELAQYDYGARFYDPEIGRWNVVDPANQFDDITPYGAMANNPVLYADPDGRFFPLVPILIGAAIGGTINLAAHLIKNDGHISFWQGVSAFGIGAAGGAAAVVTGGAALAASGFTATSVFGGVVAGMAGSAASSPILGLGNNLAFGDPYSFSNFTTDVALGGITGGTIGGISAPKGSSIWTGISNNRVLPTLDGAIFYEDLVEQAKLEYPKLANKIELHHIDPKYMGGAKNGPLVPLNAAYHRKITNEFLKYWKFGQGHVLPAQANTIFQDVYKVYPLPKGYNIPVRK